MLLDFKARGIGILVCTPYLDEAERCDRVGFIAGGRIIDEGTPADLRRSVPGHWLEARLAEPLLARQGLLGQPGVLKVVVHGNRLHVALEQAETATQVEAHLKAGAWGVRDVRPVQPSLEDAFTYRLEQVDECAQDPAPRTQRRERRARG